MLNDFETRARAKKAAKIAAVVPAGYTTSRRRIAKVAAKLATFTQEQRDRWARVAGVASPSDATWLAVVATVLAMPPSRHRHDFRNGDVCSACDVARAA